ncbi:response regulator [Cupriavidus sp. 2SB]|uniref:response regulator transcription factor n=1 Tax=Cupriavidus sp. 2SB TaxID=2502199 RepID=UPI0010FA121A|nr:response regulator [Cupriavidus sp. 2SB]
MPSIPKRPPTESHAIDSNACVIVVEDDEMLCSGMESLFRSMALDVRCYPSAVAFLGARIPDVQRCLVLDIQLRGPSGLELQAMLRENGDVLPVIFISAHGDVATTVAAMKAGATNFLAKPFRENDLIDAVMEALRADGARRARDREDAGLRAAYESLTPREREVMALATQGFTNKEVARHVGISEVTVKLHRSNAAQKMRARTFADLVIMAHHLGLRDHRRMEADIHAPQDMQFRMV